MPNMKDLSLRVKKLWLMLKFFDGQTDGRTEGQTEGRTDRRTDRVITIGHPPKFPSAVSEEKSKMSQPIRSQGRHLVFPIGQKKHTLGREL